MSREAATTVQVHPIIDSLTDETISVVRVTRTVERIAGPFASIAQAKRWINDNRDQPALFDS